LVTVYKSGKQRGKACKVTAENISKNFGKNPGNKAKQVKSRKNALT
jgi:hypothetical protein